MNAGDYKQAKSMLKILADCFRAEPTMAPWEVKEAEEHLVTMISNTREQAYRDAEEAIRALKNATEEPYAKAVNAHQSCLDAVTELRKH